MAVTDFPADKAAILAIIRSKRCKSLSYYDRIITSYDSMVSAAIENPDTFNCDIAYLTSLCAAIPDNRLVEMGVYYNKTGTITNPRMIVGGSITKAVIDQNATMTEILIAGGASVTEIEIGGSKTIVYLNIIGHSVVTTIKTVMGATLKEAHVNGACGATIRSQLVNVSYGAAVQIVNVDEYTDTAKNGLFGGFECAPLTASAAGCIEEVSGASASIDPKNGRMTIVWANPTNSVERKVFYRTQGQSAWLEAIGGAYVGNDTYRFPVLSAGIYEYLVQNKCSSTSTFSAGVQGSFTINTTA